MKWTEVVQNMTVITDLLRDMADFFCFKFSAKNVSILQGGYSSLVVAKATKYSSGWALIMFVCVRSLKYN